MADTSTQPEQAPQPATEQVTSLALKTKPQKNPKHMAAGKLTAQKTKQAREAQKKAAAEAAIIITNNKATATQPAPAPRSTPEPASETQGTRNILTTTQWLSVISIFVSVIGIYYKREEIKERFFSKTPPAEEKQKPPPTRKRIRAME